MCVSRSPPIDMTNGRSFRLHGAGDNELCISTPPSLSILAVGQYRKFDEVSNDYCVVRWFKAAERQIMHATSRWLQ